VAQDSESPQHFSVLDGMRGIGALVIVAGHAMMTLDLIHLIPHAQTGVDLFFALSGFVICHAYQERMQKGMTVADFTQRRLIRLYPLIPLSVVLGAFVFAVKLFVQHKAHLISAVLGSSLLHLGFLPSPWLVLEGEGDAWAINTPLWSLTAEMFANLAFGFGLWKLSTRGLSVLALVGAVAFAYFAVQLGDTNVGGEWANLHVGLARVVYPFCAGMILWHVTRNHRQRAQIPAFWVLTLMLVVILAPNMGRFNVAYGLLVIWVAVPLLVFLGAFRSKMSNRFVLMLGEISYPVYLVHYPIIRILSFAAKKLSVMYSAPWLLVSVDVVVSAAFGYVVFRFYDDPVRRWLTALSKKRAVAAKSKAKGRPLNEIA
jgi:peptidoglycan/LPS O-acetylase OafA/YrhL